MPIAAGGITPQLPPADRLRMARMVLEDVARELLARGMKIWEVRQSFDAMAIVLERFERKRKELAEFMNTR